MEATNITPGRTGIRSENGERTEIASFDHYADAQAAVDRLSDEGFAVEHLSIVADGLRVVEHVTGRRRYQQAVAGGALSGAWLGAILGLFFGLFDWVDPLVSGLALAFYGLVLGAAAGGLVGAVMHWATAGRRDFSSVAGVEADRYVVVCDSVAVDEARTLLTGQSGIAVTGPMPTIPR